MCGILCYETAIILKAIRTGESAHHNETDREKCETCC